MEHFEYGESDTVDKLNQLVDLVNAGPFTAEPAVTPGTVAQYWRGDKTWRDLGTDVRAVLLTGLSLATATAVVAGDTLLAALGKLQAQVSLKADASATTAALATKANVNSTGLKNRLRNGDFRIMQRGVVTGGGRTLDGWLISTAGAIGGCAQFIGANYGGYYTTVMTVQGAAGNTGSNARQLIEADDCQDLVGSAVTLSYWFYHSTGVTQNIGCQINSANGRNNFSALSSQGTSGNVPVASGVWTKLVYTVTLGAGAANGLEVIIGAGMGALAAANNIAFGEVQLEKGSEATAYDRRPVALELARCQRYFQRSSTLIFGSYGGAGQVVQYTHQFKQSMRGSPVAAISGANYANASTAQVNSSSTEASYMQLTIVSAGYGYTQINWIDFSAELT